MRKSVIIFFLLLNLFCLSEVLIDKPIELAPKAGCSLEEFCAKHIKDIEIEKFIKQEFNRDFYLISLDKCIDIALLNNYNIEILEKKYKAQDYTSKYYMSKFLPKVSTTSYIADYEGQFLIDKVLVDDVSEVAMSLSLSVEHSLFEGGKQIFEYKAQKNLKRSDYHNLNFEKNKTIYLTSKYYYELLNSKLNIEIHLRNLIERNAQLTLSANLKNAGLGTNFDVIRSKNEATNAKISLLRSLNEFKIAQAKLANVMGIELNSFLVPFENDVFKLEIFDNSIPIEKKFDFAFNNREDLKSLKESVKYEKNQNNVLKTEFIPKPSVIYQKQFQGTASTTIRQNDVFAAYLLWAPGENIIFGTLFKIKAQREKIKKKIIELENQFRQIQEQIVEASSKSNFVKREVKLAHDNLDFAQQSVKLSTIRFTYGKGIFLDLITAQSEVTRARMDYVSAVIRYNISQLDLSFYCGLLTKKLILENYLP